MAEVKINRIESRLLDGVSVRYLYCLLMVLIAFMDSSVMYKVYPMGKVFQYGLKFFCLLLLPFLMQRVQRKEKYLLFFAVIPLCWDVIDESSLLGVVQFFYSGAIPLMAFALLKDEEQITIVDGYLKLFTFFCIIGLPFYLLLNTYGVIPHTTFNRGNDGRTYYNFFWLYFTHGFGYSHARFYSVFDEPGVVGTFISVFLLYYRKYLPKWVYFTLSIVGILTFSLFFILMLVPIIYLSDLRYLSIPKQVRKVIIFIMALGLGYLAANWIGRYTYGKGVYEVVIHNRFEWKNNWIVGVHNNRDASIQGFEEGYKEFLTQTSTLEYWIGHGKSSVRRDFGTSGLSYRIHHYEKGTLSLLYFALFFILIHDWRGGLKNIAFNIFSILFLTLLFFQRPVLYSLPNLALIYVGLRLIPPLIQSSNSNKQIT